MLVNPLLIKGQVMEVGLPKTQVGVTACASAVTAQKVVARN